MAKKTIEVDRTKFEAALTQAEADGPLQTLGSLWKTVTELYNAGNPADPINEGLTYLRFRQWGLTCKTTSGKASRGPMTAEHKAKLAAGRTGVRRTRGEKFHDNPRYDDHIKRLEEVTPEAFSKLIVALKKGSIRAAVKLQCLQCVGFDRREVKECTGITCPLFLLRPYQKANLDEPGIVEGQGIDDPEPEEPGDTEVDETEEDAAE